MRRTGWLMILTTIAATACDRPAAPAAPTIVPPPAPAAPPSEAAITISSFAVKVTPAGGNFAVDGLFTLTETSGHSGAILSSVRFETGGSVDVQDATCWGDSPIRIPGGGSFESATLGYCAPRLWTSALTDSAAVAITLQNDDGQRTTVAAMAPVPR